MNLYTPISFISFLKNHDRKSAKRQVVGDNWKVSNSYFNWSQIGNKQYAYEIKSGSTYSQDYFKRISFWAKLSGTPTEQCRAIYTGDTLLKHLKERLHPGISKNISCIIFSVFSLFRITDGCSH
jgi:hypothetical protein